MAIVYIITNRSNKKSYIGHTVRRFDQRWNSHLSSVRQGSKFRFHSAIRKHGVDDWDHEILFEHEDVNVVKKKEEELIILYGLMDNKRGYNARPGGCGGWIVPAEKYGHWKQKQSENNTGLLNPNSIGHSNSELIDFGKIVCYSLGRIVGHGTMVKECFKIGIRFPKSFRKLRFDGDYRNFVSILEKELNMVYEPYFRSEEQRDLIRKKLTGTVGPNLNKKVVIDSYGKKRYVKD